MAANSVNSSANINPQRFDVANLRDATRPTSPGNINFNVTNVQNVTNLIASANNGNQNVKPIPGTTKNASDGSWSVTQLNVAGPFNAPATNPSAPGRGSGAAVDAGFNGNAYEVSGKNKNNANQPPVIFINGINTNLPGARQTAASIANLTGSKVDLVYNSSDPAVGGQITLNHFDRLAREQAEAAASKIPAWLPSGGGGLGGIGGGSARQDVYNATYQNALASSALGREAGDWAKRNTLHNPPASQTAANLILDQLNNTTGPVKVVGYSQGGAIASDALRRVESQLVSSYGQEKATEMMSRVRFLGLGAAADGNDVPRGVKFNGVAHSGDVVARYFGITRQGNGPGVGAIFSGIGQRGSFAQHLNYVDGQGGAGSKGDPASERLLQSWYSGVDIGNREIPNFGK